MAYIVVLASAIRVANNRPSGRVAMQRIANPCTAVRFRSRPPISCETPLRSCPFPAGLVSASHQTAGSVLCQEKHRHQTDHS